MGSTSPWSVKGIDSEIREMAKAAAKRDKMTVGAWISRAIRQEKAASQTSTRARTAGSTSRAAFSDSEYHIDDNAFRGLSLEELGYRLDAHKRRVDAERNVTESRLRKLIDAFDTIEIEMEEFRLMASEMTERAAKQMAFVEDDITARKAREQELTETLSSIVGYLDQTRERLDGLEAMGTHEAALGSKREDTAEYNQYSPSDVAVEPLTTGAISSAETSPIEASGEAESGFESAPNLAAESAATAENEAVASFSDEGDQEAFPADQGWGTDPGTAVGGASAPSAAPKYGGISSAPAAAEAQPQADYPAYLADEWESEFFDPEREGHDKPDSKEEPAPESDEGPSISKETLAAFQTDEHENMQANAPAQAAEGEVVREAYDQDTKETNKASLFSQTEPLAEQADMQATSSAPYLQSAQSEIDQQHAQEIKEKPINMLDTTSETDGNHAEEERSGEDQYISYEKMAEEQGLPSTDELGQVSEAGGAAPAASSGSPFELGKEEMVPEQPQPAVGTQNLSSDEPQQTANIEEDTNLAATASSDTFTSQPDDPFATSDETEEAAQHYPQSSEFSDADSDFASMENLHATETQESDNSEFDSMLLPEEEVKTKRWPLILALLLAGGGGLLAIVSGAG